VSAAHRLHAVGDGDDEDEGDDVCDGEGEGDDVCDGEGEGDFDGLGEGDFDGLGEGDDVECEGEGVGDSAAGSEDDNWPGDDTEVWPTAGEDPAVDPGAAAVAGAAAGLVGGVRTLAWAAWELLAWAVGWAAWADAAWEPKNVSSVTPTAARTHTAMAAAAIAVPGWARMLAHLSCVIARENLANHTESARRATRRRYATASSAEEVAQLKTCSRSSGGSGAGGSRREKAVGRSAPHS